MKRQRKPNRRKAAPRNGKAVLKNLGRLLAVVLLAGVLAGMVWGARQFYQWLDAPVQVIAVEGKFQRISQRELQQLVEPLVRGGIVSLDLVAVRDELQHHPWVSDAWVSRQWPDGVRIFVEEEVPIARWNNRGFLNSRGQLMDVGDNSDLTGLPQLAGPEGSEQQVMTRYREMAELLQPVDLGIAEMAMDQRGVLQMQLRDGFEVRLGKGNVLAKVRRMLVVWNAGLAAQRERIAALDLRYTNGVAVSWRSDLAQR